MRVIVVLAVLAAFGFLVAQVVAMSRRSLATPAAADHNHLAMARWIERQMTDDMVRVTITPNQQELAEALLLEFYGDDDHKRKELP